MKKQKKNCKLPDLLWYSLRRWGTTVPLLIRWHSIFQTELTQISAQHLSNSLDSLKRPAHWTPHLKSELQQIQTDWKSKILSKQYQELKKLNQKLTPVVAKATHKNKSPSTPNPPQLNNFRTYYDKIRSKGYKTIPMAYICCWHDSSFK